LEIKGVSLQLWVFLPILQGNLDPRQNQSGMKTNLTYDRRKNSATPIKSLAALLLILISQLLIVTHRASAQCSVPAPSLVFANPVLIGGVDGQVGAIYRFPNVGPGLDAHIQILTLANGAQLGEIDNTTQGYFDAWQPYVTAGANDTSYLDWHISFKKAGTNIDTVLPCLAVTAVDVDGDNANLKEFVQASTPGAYAIDPFYTTLTVTFDGVNNRAIGQITTIPLIDTFHREAMFQMNFANVSSIVYRNGSISTKNSDDVRHTCIYFKPFFYDILVILPVKLHSFNATVVNQTTRLQWTVQEESGMHSYTVQRSLNGTHWSEVNKVFAMNTPGFNSYYMYDQQQTTGTVYYRLQLTDNNGKQSYSHVIQSGIDADRLSVKGATVVRKSLSMQVTTPTADVYSVRLYSMQGQLIMQKQFAVSPGANQFHTDLPPSINDALYIVTITNKQGHLLYTNKLLRRH
jgi:hypothetical protein